MYSVQCNQISNQNKHLTGLSNDAADVIASLIAIAFPVNSHCKRCQYLSVHLVILFFF